MANKQTRRTVSMSRATYDAVKQRSSERKISAAQYVQELIAADLLTIGVEPPAHSAGLRRLAEERLREREAKEQARRERAMTAEAVSRVLRSVPRDIPRTMPLVKLLPPQLEEVDALPAAIDAGCCAWCGSSFRVRGKPLPGREPTPSDRGDMHAECLRECQRLEAKHPAVDNRVTVEELVQRRVS